MSGLLRLFRKPKPEVCRCEVCGEQGVNRIGIWDHCPKGHTYVGERADRVTSPTRDEIFETVYDIVCDHPMWEGVEYQSSREAKIGDFCDEVASALMAVLSSFDARVEALRTRLGQSEWIVCAEALRILDSTLCQHRHHGQVCILMDGHAGPHEMRPDTAHVCPRPSGSKDYSLHPWTCPDCGRAYLWLPLDDIGPYRWVHADRELEAENADLAAGVPADTDTGREGGDRA